MHVLRFQAKAHFLSLPQLPYFHLCGKNSSSALSLLPAPSQYVLILLLLKPSHSCRVHGVQLQVDTCTVSRSLCATRLVWAWAVREAVCAMGWRRWGGGCVLSLQTSSHLLSGLEIQRWQTPLQGAAQDRRDLGPWMALRAEPLCRLYRPPLNSSSESTLFRISSGGTLTYIPNQCESTPFSTCTQLFYLPRTVLKTYSLAAFKYIMQNYTYYAPLVQLQTQDLFICDQFVSFAFLCIRNNHCKPKCFIKVSKQLFST